MELNLEPGRYPAGFFATSIIETSSPKESEAGWVARTLATPAQKGQRHDTLTSLAGYFTLTGVGSNVATEILQLWNNKNNIPIEQSELERTVKSIYKASRKTKLPTDSKVIEAPDGQMFNLMDFGKYMSTYAGQDANWVITDWLPESSITFLVSAPGGHKTWMLLDLAISVASGSPFLGRYPVTDKGPVILIQQEDFHGQTVQRLSVIAHNRLGLSSDGDSIQLPPKLPIFVHPDRKLRFNDDKILRSLCKQVEEIRPKLVILDPLYSAAETDDFMASTAEQMFILKELRDKFGTGFVIAHHTNKGKDTGSSIREQAWGSQFLNAFLETGWQLRPRDDSVRVQRHFKMFANPKEVYLKFDIDTVDSYTYQVKEVQPKKDKKPTKVDLDAIELPEEETVPDSPFEEEPDVNPIRKKKGQSALDGVFDLFEKNKEVRLTAEQVAKHVEVPVEEAKKALTTLIDKKWVIRDFHNFQWNQNK